MDKHLRNLLLVLIGAGAVSGLAFAIWGFAQGQWPTALIAAVVYIFSLIIVS